MSPTQEAAMKMALEALEDAKALLNSKDSTTTMWFADEITALRASLAEPTVKESLQVESAFAENATTQQQLEEAPPSDYRRGYWDGFEIGKREGRIEAENALAEPVQEPVQDGKCKHCVDGCPACDARKLPVQEPVAHKHEWFSTGAMEPGKMRCIHCGIWNQENAPPQRKPLTEEEIDGLMQSIGLRCADDGNERMANHAEWERRQRRRIARAVEAAHGIK